MFEDVISQQMSSDGKNRFLLAFCRRLYYPLIYIGTIMVHYKDLYELTSVIGSVPPGCLLDFGHQLTGSGRTERLMRTVTETDVISWILHAIYIYIVFKHIY